MSYASIVFALGALVFAVAVLAPMRWIRDDRESFTRKRTRGGIGLAVLFLSFALLHFVAVKMEEPPHESRLKVFDA